MFEKIILPLVPCGNEYINDNISSEVSDNRDNVVQLDVESSQELERTVSQRTRNDPEREEFDDALIDLETNAFNTQFLANNQDENNGLQASTSEQHFNQASGHSIIQPSTSRQTVPQALTSIENLSQEPSTSRQDPPNFSRSGNISNRPIRILPRVENSNEFPSAPKRKRLNVQATHESERRELLTSIRESLATAARSTEKNISEEAEVAATIGRFIEVRLRHWNQEKQFKVFDLIHDLIRNFEGDDS